MSRFASWVNSDIASVRDSLARALLAPLLRLPAASWPASADPAGLEELIVQNRVASEFRRCLSAAGSAAPGWASTLRPTLEARLLQEGHRVAVRTAAVRAVGSAFLARGFEAVALKGFHLAHAVYAAPTDRPFGDVDLLVSPSVLTAAEEALVSLGYRRGHAQTGAGAMEKSFDREVAPGVVLEVDLHWSLMGQLSLVREMRPDDQGTLGRSTPAFPGLRFPTPEDALVLAAVNLVRHGFRPLGNILDFRELVRLADPGVLAARAAATRTSAALSAGLALAEALFGAVIPDSLVRALVLPRWQRALFRRLLKPEALVRVELANCATARYALKILSHDGTGGVARSIGRLPGFALRRLAR